MDRLVPSAFKHTAVNASNFSTVFTTLKENSLSESNSYYAEQRIF